jgi:predicted transcriptional regulator
MTNVVTARISDEALALVDRLAASRDRSRAWILAKLIESAAKKQVEMDDFIQVGLDDIDAGRTIPHEEVVAHIMERRTRRVAA